MAGALLGGAALGVAFEKLASIVVEQATLVAGFKNELQRLETTLHGVEKCVEPSRRRKNYPVSIYAKKLISLDNDLVRFFQVNAQVDAAITAFINAKSMMPNHVAQDFIVVEMEVAQPNHLPFFTATVFFFKCFAAIRSVMDSVGRLWINYYPRTEFIHSYTEIMPRCTLNFVITCLLAFAGIKSQGQTGFPFDTHPQAIMASVTSILMYGFTSAAEHVISDAGPYIESPTTTLWACDCVQFPANLYTVP